MPFKRPHPPRKGNLEYVHAVETRIQKMENFRPRFALISPGVDGHMDNSWANIRLAIGFIDDWANNEDHVF
jgi:acetoin utilization deacetylase AcuC-like enzyme